MAAAAASATGTAAAANGLLPPDRCGWLEKRGGFRKNWSKRWFILRDNELKYYKTEKVTPTTSPQGTINLDGCAVEIAPEPKYSRKFCFELNSPHQNRVFVIMAENGTSLQDWMNAIRRAMLRIRREKTKAESANRKNKSAQDVDGEGGVSAKVNSESAAAAAALATAPPPPTATSANNFGAPLPTSENSKSSSSNHSSSNHLSADFASAGNGVHRQSTASKSEANRPVDAPPPVATSASRFNGAAVSKQDDNHKFDVYLQWLEEQNKDKTAAGGGGGGTGTDRSRSGSQMHHTGHHQLLDDESGNSGGNGGCCAGRCTIM